MKKEEVKVLLDKYFEGETNLQEEVQLKKFFASDPESHKEFKEAPLFLALIAEKEIRTNEMSFVLPKEEKPAFSRSTILKWAASIIIILGSIGLLIPWQGSEESQNIQYVDSYSDPEEAYLEAKKALAMVSSKINAGRADAAGRVSKFKEVLPIKN